MRKTAIEGLRTWAATLLTTCLMATAGCSAGGGDDPMVIGAAGSEASGGTGAGVGIGGTAATVGGGETAGTDAPAGGGTAGTDAPAGGGTAGTNPPAGAGSAGGGAAGSVASGGTTDGDGGTDGEGTGGNGTAGSGGTGGGSGIAGSGGTGDEFIQFIGRWDFSNPDAPTTSWGNSIKIKFEGTGVSITLSQTSEIRYQYRIDDGAFTNLSSSGNDQTHQLATGLAAGVHRLEFVRRLEASYGTTTFHGFNIEGGELVLSDARPPVRMEFIGDSITAGYKSEGAGNNIDMDNVYMAYGPRIARDFGAEWNTVARSGISMAHSSDGVHPAGTGNSTMPTRYGDLHYYHWIPWDKDYQTDCRWDFSQWIPDIVTVFLGTNDYVFGSPSQTEFETAYSNFLTTVRGYYPSAYIYVLNPLVGTTADNNVKWENCKTYLQNVVSAKNAAGDSRVFFVALGTQADPWLNDPNDYSGDRTHPNPGGHSIIAENLKAFMLNTLDADLLARIGQ